MTTLTEHRTIIVPAAMRDMANAVAHVLDPDEGGASTFQAGLSPDGQAPATHYLCSAPFTTAIAAVLDSTDASAIHTALQQLAASRQRSYTLSLAEAQTLRDSLVVSPLAWRDAIAENDLQLVQEEDYAS